MSYKTKNKLNENIIFRFLKDKKIDFDSETKLFIKTFFLDEVYLGEIGRTNLNKKLNITTKTQNYNLRPEDILTITNYLINLNYGNNYNGCVKTLSKHKHNINLNLVKTILN